MNKMIFFKIVKYNMKMQLNGQNNLQIKITQKDNISKKSIQNVPQQMLKQSLTKINGDKVQTKIKEMGMQNHLNEKQKKQIFEEPDIQSMIENTPIMSEHQSTFGFNSVSQHLSQYYEFFSIFDFQNKQKTERKTKIQENDFETSQKTQANQQKIRINSKEQIRQTLFKKGIYIKSLSENFIKKNPNVFQSQNRGPKFQCKGPILTEEQTKEKLQDDINQLQIEDDQQSMSKWILFEQNLTNQYRVQKLFKHIERGEQAQNNQGPTRQIIESPKCEYQFFRESYHNSDPQQSENKDQKSKSLKFKILQIRSTFSPEAFDIICSVGQIYILKVSLLINLNDSYIHKHIVYSEGSYGNIYLLNGKINCKKGSKSQENHPSEINDNIQLNKDFFVVKCFKLRDNEIFNELLHSVLKQYCMNSIMSALQIGPKIVRKFGFDLMVYPNCIEYCLQFCQNKKTFQKGKTDIDLKTALLTMHQINLVHLDIKPDNIAFSRYFNKWVFLDFGFSDFIDEKLGEKTFLCYVGTYEYSSPEMKKALTSDGYVDLYFNDVYALKRSFFFMDRFEEILSGSNSSIYYNHTVSLLLSIEIHHNFIEQVLIVTLLKYFLLRQNLKKSRFYLKCLQNYVNNQQKSYMGKVCELKNAKNKIKVQAQYLFPLFSKENETSPTGLSLIKEIQEEQKNWIKFQESKLKLHSNHNPSNESIGHNCNNINWQSKAMKSAKKDIVRFYRSLILTEFYVDFYYEHSNILVDDFQLHMQIQKKIKSSLVHRSIKFQTNQKDTSLLKKIKQKLFQNYLKKQCNQIEENIDFDKLYALSLSLNQTQYATALLAKKSIHCQNQCLTYRKQKINNKKGIMNLKQKLLDKRFLDNLSQEECFNLYYRYITFRKNIYDAKLQDKLTVSQFFIKYWKVNCQKYLNFETIFEEFINEQELKQYLTTKTVVYSEDDHTHIIQTQCDHQKRKNYRTKVCKILSDQCPLYAIIICFRFIIANCIYIHPSNFQKRELFITLICQYFLIDRNIFTYQNDFNFFVPWCKIIIKHHSFFKSQEQAIQYLCKHQKHQDVNSILKEAKINQNFLELLQRLWRLNQSSRVLNHRLEPTIWKYADASYYKQHIEFILKDRKTLRNHFSSEIAMEKFIKMIDIQQFVQQGTPAKDLEQFFFLEEDLRIVKNEILKSKNLTSMTKVNMLKLISLQLFVYDNFIQEIAKISQILTKQKELLKADHFLHENDVNTGFKDEIKLLKSSQSYFQNNYVVSNAKKIMLELANTPLSCTGIEDFHFHLVQRLRMQGKFLECQSIIKLIDRTINCKEVSNNFLDNERRYIYYYIQKNEFEATESFQRSVNQFNEYEIICNIGWLEELITYTSIAISQQPTRINQNLQKMISKKQRDEYFQKNQQYAAYVKLLQVQETFVSKLKKYIKTCALTLDSNIYFVSRKDYNNFFRIIKHSLNFLKTSPPKQFFKNFSSKSIFKDYKSKKDIFYDVFEKALPFCSKNLNKITKNPLTRRLIYCINDEQEDLEKEFRLIKLQAQAMRYFEQQKYINTISIVHENLEQLGIKTPSTIDPVISKLECIKCMMIYVKAFFIQYRLKNYCWYEKYNCPQSADLKIGDSRQELIEFIQKQSSLIDESEKRYEVTYQQILRILYLYFVTTGQFLLSMQFNAPTLQFLVETAKNVGDEKSYFRICLYLVSVSRYLSKNSHFKWTAYVMGNIEEFANKNIPSINKPLFEYLIKFTQRIIVNQDENFSSQSKEWKNPTWWLFVNIFLKYVSIGTPIVRKMLVKIASVLEYLDFKLRDQISPLFYINYLRYKDMEAFKGRIPLNKLKCYLRKLHKFQAKRSYNQCKIDHYLRIRFKSFCGISPILFQQIPRDYHERSYLRVKDSFQKRNDELTDKKQPEDLCFFCIKFEGIEKELNCFYTLNKDQLNPPQQKEKYQLKSQKQILQNEKEKQTQQKNRQNLVRKPSFCRSDIEDKENEKDDKNGTPYSFAINFNYEFKKKFQDTYFKFKENPNLAHAQFQINSTKGRIFRTIVEKIYVQQKNIENIHLENLFEHILTKKNIKRQNFSKGFSSFTEYEQI